MISNPPSDTLIASSVKMTDSNFVTSGTTLVGYKYVLSNLVPNTTYYFIIVAKKSFIEFEDNQLQTITMQSLPAMKTIITPTNGAIDQPVVPGKPPLSVKKTADGLDMVTGTSATIQLMNKWYEEFVMPQDGGMDQWEYKTPSELEADSGDPDIISKIENQDGQANPDPLKYRKVEYDSGVTIDVFYTKYTPDIDYTNLDQLTASQIIGIPVTPNDPDEDVTAPDALPDGLKHNVDITINNLDPNCTYIIWVKAARMSADLISGPSDPLIITTIPEIGATLEKPTVPVFDYSNPADTYVDLGWDFNFTYTYHIKYSKTDDAGTAGQSVDVTPDDLKFSSYYRVTGLDPGTLYFFWIQAESTDQAGNTAQSDWSDSLAVQTLPYAPPPTPEGFGVKCSSDAVTKDSITFEWMPEDGMSYVLQVASNIDYTDVTEYTVGVGSSEYTVNSLKSNLRYYARLYAYDPNKQLRSDPTQSIAVRTEPSTDEYDSNADVENVPSGSFIDKDETPVNNTWNVKITGINAERFIEYVQTDNQLDYNIDLRSAPAGTNTISLLVSGEVFKALSMLGENLMVQSDRNTLVIRPGMLDPEKQSAAGTDITNTSYQIAITLDDTANGSNTANLSFKTPVSSVGISLETGDGKETPIQQFDKPLKFVYDYTSPDWYKAGVTAGYILKPGSTDWQKLDTSAKYDSAAGKGQLSFETGKTGRLAVIEPGTDLYDDIGNSFAKNSIINVASAHKLKSITGSSFQPDNYLTNGDAVKFMLDMLDYNYGAGYMNYAVRAGFLDGADATKPDADCTREKLIAMVVRLYEIKTSQKATATSDDTNIYKDIGQVDSSLLPSIRFAVESGVITSRFSDTLGPKDPVTRAETMTLLEKLLKFTGEL